MDQGNRKKLLKCEAAITEKKEREKSMEKLGSLTPGYTTDLHSPEDGVRKKKRTTSQSSGGIIDLLMKKKGMKSWHDGV